jgi:hypothetical protein
MKRWNTWRAVKIAALVSLAMTALACLTDPRGTWLYWAWLWTHQPLGPFAAFCSFVGYVSGLPLLVAVICIIHNRIARLRASASEARQ